MLCPGADMRRREFISLIGSTAVAWPLAAHGQVTRKRPLIGRLSVGSRDTPLVARYIDRFLSGMRELGYVEGQDFDMTYGMADFHSDRFPQVVAEMVELAPDVILVGATIDAVAAAKATAAIPIVVAALADPVELGLIKSYARPAGRVGSSAFKLSTTTMAMSLAGSCFSTESAHWPFHHGIRRRGSGDAGACVSN